MPKTHTWLIQTRTPESQIKDSVVLSDESLAVIVNSDYRGKKNKDFLQIISTISRIKALKPGSTEPHLFKKIKWSFPSDFSSSEYPKMRSSWWVESSWSVLKLSFYIRHGLVQGAVCPPSKCKTGNCPLFNGSLHMNLSSKCNSTNEYPQPIFKASRRQRFKVIFHLCSCLVYFKSIYRQKILELE